MQDKSSRRSIHIFSIDYQETFSPRRKSICVSPDHSVMKEFLQFEEEPQRTNKPCVQEFMFNDQLSSSDVFI